MTNFTQRVITGALFGAVMISSVVFNGWTFIALFFVINVLSIWEFYKLVMTDGSEPRRYAGTVLSCLLFVLTALIAKNVVSPFYLIILIPLTFYIFIQELYLKSKKPFENLADTFIGIIYLTVPLSLFNFIAFPVSDGGDYRYETILGYFFLLWASDTGAYLFGKRFGKRKLFERHSPKKSWEGSAGGTIVTILVAYFLSQYFVNIDLIDWMVMGVLIVVTGTLGDLVESMLKRSLDVKDSGKMLPGHGGILDRFDGLFLSVPFVVTYLIFKNHFS
ncbi:MAG TPA: phosphatidate cytidylyltransferase [Bacteroidia bacterium]|nr:phosphatidate cytidylyltransferase [Bacteroidia bacterium]HNU32443.1 phosphatidate cytidylyltransferase [Bacteroidia bacterium]